MASNLLPTLSLLALISFSSWQSAVGAKILVTVMGVTGSQNLVMYRLAEQLAERGHRVDVLNTVVSQEAKAIKLKHAREIRFQGVADPQDEQTLKAVMSEAAWTGTKSSPLKFGQLKQIWTIVRKTCEELLADDRLIARLKAAEYDVIVLHMVDFCMYSMTHHLGVRSYVWMSTAFMVDPMAWYSGSPSAISYVPTVMLDNEQMSLIDRAKNLFVYASSLALGYYIINPTYTELFRKKFGDDYPSLGTILADTQLFFINADPLFEYSRPTPPNVIHVGGLTMQKPEPLDEKWQTIVDNAPNEGIVVFSLGSVTNTSFMPQESRMAFLNAFKRIPHLVIWRFEGQFPEAKSVKNVLLSDWLPQKDLLAHRKVQAAIIHGGYNSLTETTYLGVPLIVLPLFSDQYGNSGRVRRLGIGVSLDKNTLTEETVYQALQDVLYNSSVREKARRLGEMIRKRPFSSAQQAIGWVEYLAEFKTIDQFRPASINIGLLQYSMLDVYLLLLSILAAVLVLVIFVIKFLLKLCSRNGKKSKSKAD